MAVKAGAAVERQRGKEEDGKKAGPSPAAKAYLLLYNGLLTAGYILFYYTNYDVMLIVVAGVWYCIEQYCIPLTTPPPGGPMDSRHQFLVSMTT